jgi:hypothetical protein
MRCSDLLEVDVFDEHDHRWGQVHDLHLIQDGRLLAASTAAFRLHGLIVGTGSFGTRLGYSTRPGYDEAAETRGPLPIRALVRRWHRHAVYIPWSAVTEITPRSIRVHAGTEGFSGG